MWIDQSMCAPPAAQAPKRGHPVVYSDALIQGLLGLKQVFHLPLCALQGFVGSLRKLAFPDLPVPNYTTLSRRAQDLEIMLPALRPDEPLHLVIDSTGLKLYGEGEWKVPQARLVQAPHLAQGPSGDGREHRPSPRRADDPSGRRRWRSVIRFARPDSY